MPGFMPGIHVLGYQLRQEDVDGRDKPGPDKILIFAPHIGRRLMTLPGRSVPGSALGSSLA
ncbi:hypothetical protein AFEL58S_03350 [Afipia felis]